MKNIDIVPFIVLIAVVFPISNYAQSLGMWQITEADGLPSMTVYDIIQDQEDYLWMGTENGLCRYDGKNFEYFSSPFLRDNEILQLWMAQDGLIWFWNLSGQLFYISENFSLVEFNPNGALSNIKVRQFRIDEKGDYWIASYLKGLIKYEPDKKIFTNYYSKFKLQLKKDGYNESRIVNLQGLSGLEIFNNKTILSFNHSGLYSIDGSNITPYSELGIEYFSTSTPLFLKSKNSKIYIYATNFFKVLEANEDVETLQDFSKQFPIHRSTHVLEEDNDGLIWACTRKGVHGYNQDLTPINLYSSNHILSDYFVNGLFQDKDGSRWVFTTGSGIFIIPSLDVYVWNVANSSIHSNKINSIGQNNNGEYYVATMANDLFVLDSNLNSSNIFLGENVIANSVIKGPNNDIYIGNDDGIINLEVLGKYYAPTVKFSVAGSDNVLYVQNYTGLVTVDLELLKKAMESDNPLTYTHYINNTYKNTVYLNSMRDVVESKHENILWIGTLSGLLKHENDSAEMANIDGEDFLHPVTSLAVTSDSILWVGTSVDGLYGIKDNMTYYHYDQQNKLSSNTIRTLYSNSSDELWVGTNKGINRIQNGIVQNEKITIEDGLPSNDIYEIFQASNDRLFIGTNNGLVLVKLGSNDFINRYPPKVYIKSIEINGQDTLITDRYKLSHDQNTISIKFQSVGLNNKGMSYFRYKMSGLESEWITTTQNVIRYPSISPGNYKFSVEAVNGDGVHSLNPAAINFQIKKPWWTTWLFRISLAFTIISIGVLFIFSQLNRIRQREFLIQQNERLRAQALQSQMNPHFVFNALNSILHYITTGNLKLSSEYLGLFAKVVRMVFEHSKREYVSLDEEVELLKSYLELEKLRFNEKVFVKFEVEEKLDVENILIPPLLIQPIIENSFRHGLMHKEKDGILAIEIRKLNEFIHVVITDNGMGRSKVDELNNWRPKEYQSSGIKTTRERLNLAKRSLKKAGDAESMLKITDLVDSLGNGTGTSVELFIAINN